MSSIKHPSSFAPLRVHYRASEESLARELWDEDGHLRFDILLVLSDAAPEGFELDLMADLAELITEMRQSGASARQIACEVLKQLHPHEESADDCPSCVLSNRGASPSSNVPATRTVGLSRVYYVVDSPECMEAHQLSKLVVLPRARPYSRVRSQKVLGRKVNPSPRNKFDSFERCRPEIDLDDGAFADRFGLGLYVDDHDPFGESVFFPNGQINPKSDNVDLADRPGSLR